MNTENHVIVRGYDLFFRGASEQKLAQICFELGERSTYDVRLQKATNMLSQAILIELHNLESCHSVINAAGEYFDQKYACDFVTSELFVKMTENQTKTFKNKNLILISNT